MVKRQSSSVNNQTLDTFFIAKENIGKVIEEIILDAELQSVVLIPSLAGASHYRAQLRIGDDLVDIVTLMLSRGDKYLGCFGLKNTDLSMRVTLWIALDE